MSDKSVYFRIAQQDCNCYDRGKAGEEKGRGRS